MKNNMFSKLLLGAAMLLMAASFTACVDDNEDKGMPYLELGAEELPFTLEGGEAFFPLSTNRPWSATLGEGSDWIVVDPMEGVGDTKVEISVPAATRGRVGSISFHLANTYGVYETKTVMVYQGEVAAIETIYSETVGTTSVSSPYPLVGAYTGWATDGTGAAEVNYAGSNTSVRASGLANEGSGPNVIFFGAAPASFQVNKIALQPAQSVLNLSFLGSFSNKPEGASEYNNTFDLSLFEVAISGDGEKWSKLDLTKNDGDTAHPYWVKAEADFELKEVPAYLYVRFTAGFSSAFRLDDIVLATSNAATSQLIDLSQGTEGGGVDPTPTPTPSSALWHEHFGDAGEDKPEVSAYTAWEKGGSVGANVTYTAVSGKVSVRETGKLSAGYSDASGAAKLFFGTNDPAFVAGDIALTNEQTKLTLNFGGAYSKNDSGTYDNTFYADKFHVYLSGDNEKWTEISYTTAKADEYWVYATANVTLTKAPTKLYVKFAADEASVFAIDDVQLAVGDGGQSVDLDNGTTGGGNDDPNPEPTDAVSTTINALIGMMGSETVTLDKNYVFEGIVLSDVAGGNYTGNNLVLQTEGATTAKNGVVVYGSQVDPKTLGLARNDKVKVTLLKGEAQLKIYNDLYEITGGQNATWCTVEKIGTGSVTPTVITVSQMKDFQSMLVTIKDATTSAAGTWCTADAAGQHTLKVNGADLTVYVKKGAAAFVDKAFKAATGDITGLVTMYNKNVQLAPRDLNDVTAFTDGGSTPDPEPTPDPNPSGEVFFWKDDFSQFDAETADGTADLGSSLTGSIDGFKEAYQNVVKVYSAAGKVKCGSSSAKGTLTTPAFKNVSTATAEATLSIDLAAWVNTSGTADTPVITITINNGGTIDGAASVTTETLTAEMKTYTYTLSGVTSATTITIEPTVKSKKRYYLDNLIIKQK